MRLDFLVKLSAVEALDIIGWYMIRVT